MDLILAVVALIVAAWSAYTAAQARRHNESPEMDVRFVRARPWLHEHESTEPWKDPAIRITNNGPHDYDLVRVEIVQSTDEMISARSSPIISMFPPQAEGDETTPTFGKQQTLGRLQVGQFTILGVVTNPAAHGAVFTLRFTCVRTRFGGIYQQKWLTGVQVDIPPAPLPPGADAYEEPDA